MKEKPKEEEREGREGEERGRKQKDDRNVR
jgi:hypothetical protein